MLLFSASYSVRYSAYAIQVRWPIFADFIADHFLLEWWKIIKIGEQNQIYLINKSGLVFFTGYSDYKVLTKFWDTIVPILL